MFNERIDLIIYYRCMNLVMLFNLFRIVNIIFDCIILYSVCCFGGFWVIVILIGM